MKRSNFFAFAGGILLSGSMWFLRERPFFDNREIYSDAAYNTMLNITGGLIIVGCIGIAYGVYGILKDLL